MKDAKGHGSDPRGAHADGINKIGVGGPTKIVGSGKFALAPGITQLQPPTYAQQQNYWYHGSPNGEPNAQGPVHVGTERAARQALEARIGIPADGYGWHGQEYGKTLLAGQDTLRKRGESSDMFGASGFNSQAPQKDYFPTERTERAKFSNGDPVPFEAKPAMHAYQITGSMSNSIAHPTSDTRANAMAGRLKNKGTYYMNEGEDSGYVSAVVPNRSFLEKIK